MPTTQELHSAISAGNLDEVQNILGQRDQAGIPIVDINRGFGNVGTALIKSLTPIGRPINVDIVQVLLDVVDNNGNPVCDINHVGPHGQTALSFILAQKIPCLKLSVDVSSNIMVLAGYSLADITKTHNLSLDCIIG